LKLDRIDKLLQDWQHKVGLVSQNLLELHDLDIYHRLLPQRNQLDPTAQNALEQVDRLFEYFAILQNTLNQAQDLRSCATWSSDHADLTKKIDELLIAKSIVIATHQVPLSQRQIAGVQTHSQLWSLSQLFDEMTALWQTAVATLMMIEQAEQNLVQNLPTAHTLMTELHRLQQKSLTIYTESQAKCGVAPPHLLPDQEIQTLAEWLTNLQHKFNQNLLSPSTLNNWQQKALQYQQTVQVIIESHQTRLQLRQELRGRLLALKAKAIAKQRAEDPKLIDIADRAHALLHQRPTPLDQAADLVTQYEQRLNNNL
jgi:hypothetical protein